MCCSSGLGLCGEVCEREGMGLVVVVVVVVMSCGLDVDD